MNDHLEPITTETLIKRAYNYSLWKQLYTFPNRNLLR
jgi:hypothetical protein